MKKANSVVRVVLIVSALVMLATGCGKIGKGKETVSDVRDPEILTVGIYDRGKSFQGGESLTENRWTKWINEKFGEPNNIKVQFYPIPRGQEIEKLNVLMASRNAPDIIFTYKTDLFYNYAKNDGLTNLTPIIEKYGQNIKKFIGAENLKYVKYKNDIYGIPAKRAYRGQFASYIRQDWLDKLGLPLPQTTEEFYRTLKAFKEKDPGNIGKENVIPFILTAASLVREDFQQNTLHLVQSFVKPMTEEEYYTLPQLLYPGYKEGVRFLNKMRSEGLINKEFALLTDNNKFDEYIANGKVGFFTTDVAKVASEVGLYGALKQNIPDARLQPVDCFRNSEGKYPKRLGEFVGMYIMIPNFSKVPEAAVRYLDWMTVPENGFMLMNGIEGEHYKLNEDIPLPIDVEHNGKTMVSNGDLALMYNGQDFGSLENYYKNLEMRDAEYGKLRAESARMAVKDGYDMPFFTTPIESQAKYSPTLDKKFQEVMIKSIIAAPEEFDRIYDGLVEEYMKNGGEEVMKEKIEAYKVMKR